MATEGNTGWLATTNSAITQMMKWKITPGSASENKSSVQVWYYLKKNPAIQNTTTSSTDSTFTITVAGQTHQQAHVSKSVPANNTQTLIISHTFGISHNDDGTKSATITVSGGLAGTTISSLKTSKTVTFPTIARASTITSASNVTLGNAPTIKWTPYAKSFWYKLKFSIGQWSHTTGAIHPNTTSTFSYSSYQLPISDVAPQITTGKTGTVTVLLSTYSDGACKTKVGSTQNKTLTATVPSSAGPQMTSVTLTKVNSNSTIRDQWGNISLEGYTRYDIEANASTQYDADVVTFNISGAYTATVVPPTTSNWRHRDYITYNGPIITGSGTKNFTVSVTDSRGYTSAALTQSDTVYPYAAPKINEFKVARNDQDDTLLDVYIDCSYSDCANHNSVDVTLRYKKTDETSYTEYDSQRLNPVPVNQWFTVPGLTFSEEYSYDLQILLEDVLGGTALTTAMLPTANVLLDFRAGGKGLGIGKIAEHDRLEVGLDSDFSGDVYLTDTSSKGVYVNNTPLLDYVSQGQQTGYGLRISGHTVTIAQGESNKSVTVPDNNTTYALSGSAQSGGYQLTLNSSGTDSSTVTIPTGSGGNTYTLSGTDLTNGYQLSLTSSGSDSSSVTIGMLSDQDIDNILFGT